MGWGWGIRRLCENIFVHDAFAVLIKVDASFLCLIASLCIKLHSDLKVDPDPDHDTSTYVSYFSLSYSRQTNYNAYFRYRKNL